MTLLFKQNYFTKIKSNFISTVPLVCSSVFYAISQLWILDFTFFGLFSVRSDYQKIRKNNL